MEAGLLPGRNDRRKVNLIQIKVTQYFGGFFSRLTELTRYSRRPAPEDILKCCICASVRPVVAMCTTACHSEKWIFFGS